MQAILILQGGEAYNASAERDDRGICASSADGSNPPPWASSPRADC
jgi:hypothetical protein